MRLNNKGITLIEIIISIALISIVLIFLFSLLINVNDMNKDADVNSTYLINKALILKNIEEDLRKHTEGIEIKACSDFIYSNYNKSDYFNNNDSLKGYECIEIIYDNDDSAKLGIYYYKNRESYVISYIHNSTRATRALPKYKDYNVSNEGELLYPIKLTNSSNDINDICDYKASVAQNGTIEGNCNNNSNGFYKIEIPIIGSDGKDYTILISYYGKVKVS